MNAITRYRLKIDSFILGLVAVVALAFAWPAPGMSGGFLHFDSFTTYGISLVFFLYGLTLEPRKMRDGVLLWKLHLIVQLSTFVLFPVIVILAHRLMAPLLPDAIWLGFFYVAALPSTVSSSVAMTSLARGDAPAALFNASVSSLIGVFVTPVWMSWYLSRSGFSMPLMPVIAKVCLLVLLPIVLGQIARLRLADWAVRRKAFIRFADRATILAIVYNSFCDSVAANVWNAGDLVLVLEIAVAAVLLFAVVYAILGLVCRAFGFAIPERIAGQFCGSKKSLATGAPLAKVMFGASPSLGLVLAPIMIYHFLQLLIVSVLAARFAAREDDAPATVAAANAGADLGKT